MTQSAGPMSWSLAVRAVLLPDSPATEARHADGTVWRRAWALPERLVLEFVGVALVEATDDWNVAMDRELPGDLEQHLLLDHVLPLLLARRGEFVLHGAVVSLNGRAAVAVGPSGAGKSTLAAYAWQRGWALGGDDGAVICLRDGRLRARPTYPTLRLTPEATGLLGIAADAGSQAIGKRRLRTVGTGRPMQEEPVALALVTTVEPAPAGTEARLTRIAGVDAHLALFGCTFYSNLARGGALQSILDRVGDLADAVPVLRLTVPRGREGLVSAERLLREELAG